MLWEAHWYNQIARVAAIYLSAYFAGLLVRHCNLRVNYSRKINHFVVVFSPLALHALVEYPVGFVSIALSLAISMACLAVFIHPIRRRSYVVSTMFLSIDRPEDRPHTLLWLVTQYAAAFAVILPFAPYYEERERAGLLIIVALINGIGDGLAEPIGIRFGRHTYSVRALFSERTYTRSLEGSACVFLTSILAVLIFHREFTTPELLAALVLLPPLMALAEATAPHTWDTPFLFAVGQGTLIAIVELLP